ncbi:MAG: DUF3108 domain-containing protein [Gemmatimonadota bacterium]|nr:DUF3108 domain-containing protein [Gemmatimonadota bacterium]
MKTLVLALALPLLHVPAEANAQTAPAPSPFEAEWPFDVGEIATYDVTFGPIRVGRARLAVEAVDTVRATPAYRLSLELEGGPFFYKIDDRTVGWLATEPYRTVRFEEILNQGGYHRHRRYELDHELSSYVRQDWDDEAGQYVAHATERDVAMPSFALDEISFLFLVRTLPLDVGHTYVFENYFQDEGNPVVVQVLRRERVRVRAGRFETIVVRPIIQTDGLFSEGGEAEVYISDDDERRIVLLKSQMSVGEMNMYLRDLETGER